MKNRRKRDLRETGITLVALVVTIIILLILAGIAIASLTGENGLLQRVTDAKTRTDEAQIKEEIGLAWNGVQTEGIVNGWDINKKVEELQKELRKEDSTTIVVTSGNNVNVKKYKGYDAVINTTDGSFTKFAKADGETGENNKVSLTANVRETESRASVIEFKSGVKEWLKTLSSEELKRMWVKMESSEDEDNYEEYWNSHYSGYADIKDYYDNYYWEEDDGEGYYWNEYIKYHYSDEYEMMVEENKVDISFTLNGETIKGASAEFVVTKNGNYTIIATNGTDSGTIQKNVVECVNRSDNQEEKYSTTAVTADSGKNSKTVTAKDNETVEVPAGFYYGTSDNVGKVSKGFVITDSVDENGYSTGNEFVWIPVDYNSTAGTLKVKGTEKEIAKLQDGSSTNYRGVLYYWDSDRTGNTTYSHDGMHSGYNEPVTGVYDTDSKNYLSGINLTASQFATEMQEEYNNMIASIKKYGGFYVARYEMGKGSDNYSRIGVMPTSTDSSEENMWYGLYNKAKQYNKSSITAGMIWGSQYDAMLNFGLTNSLDSSKISELASANGNHSGKKLKTGTWLGSSNQTDSINNIFDLEGNMYELTKEMSNTDCRVTRGGVFDYYGHITSNFITLPFKTSDHYGSRLSLYIKI